MNDFSSHLAEDRLLVILRVLLQSAGYTANEYLLHSMVERLGHIVSADRIRTDLTILKEKDLIAVDDVAGVLIAKLLSRGEDVARGRLVVPGVKRPRAE